MCADEENTKNGIESVQPITEPKNSISVKDGITDEMREMAEKLAHPDKDPYINAREMGVYCEQCG